MTLGLAQRATRDNVTRLSLRALRAGRLPARNVLEGESEKLPGYRDLVGGQKERSES